MIKYLDYIIYKTESLSYLKPTSDIINKLKIHRKYLEKYSNKKIEEYTYPAHNKHNFHFPTGETISLSWDVDKLYEYAESHLEISTLSLSNFEKITHDDLCNSIETFSEIYRYTSSMIEHKYKPILIMNFKPFASKLIIDGRHRYMEYKKFKPNELIPIYTIDDNDATFGLLGKKDLLLYTIIHNTKVISDYMFNNGSINDLIDFIE